MLRSLFFFVVFSCPLLTAAQHELLRNDSLEKALTDAPDTTKIKIYHAAADTLPALAWKTALGYEEKALALALPTGSARVIADCHTRMGVLFRNHSAYRAAITHYKKAIEAAPSPNEAYLAETFLELGIAFLRLAQLDSATHSLQEGLRISKHYNNASNEAAVYNMLGNVAKEENNYSAASEWYIRSAQLFEKINDKSGLTQSLSNVGNLQLLMGNEDQALEYALKSLSIAEDIKKKSSIAYSNRLLGRIYRKQQRYDDAIRVSLDAIKIYQSLGAQRDIAETHLATGNTFYDKNDFHSALEQYFMTIKTARGIGDSVNMAYGYTAAGFAYQVLRRHDQAHHYYDTAMTLAGIKKIPALQMDIHDNLSALYADHGNYKSAFEHHIRFTQLKDSLEEIRNRQEAEELEAKYNSEKKEREIQKLNAENALKALQLDQHATERNYLIGLTVLSVLLIGVFYNLYKTKLKSSRKLQELDEMKSRFFANISHEFRTPLSLILGPLQAKLQHASSPEEKGEIGRMVRNANRLLRLINQILDLSRIESGNLKIRVTERNISGLLGLIFSSFSSLAEQKGINYHHLAEDDSITGYIDADKLEKILYNLLSNAFKFTPEGGEITMHSRRQYDRLVIQIKDSGVGISPDKQAMIFNRFFQIDDSPTRPDEGTGIGLALARELAELHRGKISVTSTIGQGSEFMLVLPIAKSVFKAEEIGVSGDQAVTGSNFIPAGIAGHLPFPEGDHDHRPLVLIAEDNADMLHFIGDVLQAHFRVTSARDGQEAWQKTQETIPDLIISDLMMPKMDGAALCRLVKQTAGTSHIPLILLTARADHKSRIEGLRTGADDYLTKPFNAEELSVRVNNLIELRSRLRSLFREQVTVLPTDIPLAAPDAIFLKKVIAIVETHHSNALFGVEEFTHEVALSRMQLHRKLKSLTGKSPGEFIRQFRLERAKQLLALKGIQVSEVAYRVGFNNLSNFTKVFKDFTGHTPSEFMQQENEVARPE
ncbi:MAG TPA: ATP-binding protein [Ohtaekwangia sp.]|nr:ATP-binding protein [Ohtaekwangia sp.]